MKLPPKYHFRGYFGGKVQIPYKITSEMVPQMSWKLGHNTDMVNIKGWSQNRVKIFYLYNVKIERLTPSPSIFTDGFSPVASYDHHGQETFHFNEGKPTLYTHTLKWCVKIVVHI